MIALAISVGLAFVRGLFFVEKQRKIWYFEGI
jgi:hypothetical protein